MTAKKVISQCLCTYHHKHGDNSESGSKKNWAEKTFWAVILFWVERILTGM